MRNNSRFSNLGASFWATVQMISQYVGYLPRVGNKAVFKNVNQEYLECRIRKRKLDISVDDVTLAQLTEYYNYRTGLVKEIVNGMLRSKSEAIADYNNLMEMYPDSKVKVQYNKQGEKAPLVFTNTINVITESVAGLDFDDNPKKLAFIQNDRSEIIYTFSRRMDGSYPSIKNPQALWEIKENYSEALHFGSRISDSVYLTRLDGTEIKMANELSGGTTQCYVLVDGKTQWGRLGKSYLCRFIDLLQIGLIDQVLFGREVLDEWPKIVSSWIEKA